MRSNRLLALALLPMALLLLGAGRERGLDPQALDELAAAGVNKYAGAFEPVASEALADGWVRHSFDTDGGDGPVCIAETPFAVFTRARNPNRLLFFMQGGGACWQDFYFCNLLADALPPPLAGPASGIWADSFDAGSETIRNPLHDWSVVYVPYCDGSVFAGDNDVDDPNFPFAPVRRHRGLRNATAAMDLAKDIFPRAKRILIAGSSAGGVGAAALAPFLARFVYGNSVRLMVLNDAGPVAINLDETAAIEARAADWQFGQFLPASCSGCDEAGQITAIIEWRLERDRSVREAFYSTDGDAVDRFFVNIPTQEEYRELIVTEHGALHAAYPDRYKRFIRSGDDEHTALQLPTFYLGEANGVPLYQWTSDFVKRRRFWIDIVEDFVPAP
ncbi:MAG: hypothetical protein JSU66_00115 [Deltaproteobacteria bacterium]|nr:MAG: hypothetical protein JSU66_00115 [Deltaproteobacteria bacterium]